MQKTTLIIGSSFLSLAAVFVLYNNSQEDTINQKIQNPKLITETPTVKPPILIEKETEEVKKIQSTIHIEETSKVDKLLSKYNISILPENMNVQEKKQRFKELLVPAIDDVYMSLEKQYLQVKRMIENGTDTDTDTINTLIKEYNAKDAQDLLARLKPHPKSIAMAQAAMQSGWATSRFTLNANNLFGVWSFDENEPRVQAHETRDGEAVYVKRYESLKASVEGYYKLLATSPLFEEFREEKMTTNDSSTLIKSLDKYYKKGDDYAKGLVELIKFNKLEDYDK